MKKCQTCILKINALSLVFVKQNLKRKYLHVNNLTCLVVVKISMKGFIPLLYSEVRVHRASYEIHCPLAFLSYLDACHFGNE